jgi:poly(A)-specific ribonuclease
MEIDQAHFRRQLLPILKHISEATFVTFDLEMSGISTRPKHSSADRTHDIGRPTLQQQYEDMKSAAETFQVLQVGITCVEEDRDRGRISWETWNIHMLKWTEYYLARPFNFNLSPLSADGVELKLERTFQFSSSACDFLAKNSFDFGKVFREGIPYLSRKEEDVMREEFNSRINKQASIPDVIIPTNEPTTLDFYDTSRQTISEWTKDPKV